MYWVEDDDNDNNIAEPGEAVELQMARWNPTDLEVENVRTTLDTTDEAILGVTQDLGDHDDILQAATEFINLVEQANAQTEETANEDENEVGGFSTTYLGAMRQVRDLRDEDTLIPDVLLGLHEHLCHKERGEKFQSKKQRAE